jgi:hypothetical protein
MKQEPKMTKRAAEAARTIKAYQRLFSTDDGQIVMKDLMKSCFLSRSVIGADPHETYFNEGVRSVMLRLLQQANIDDKQIERIILEMNRTTDDILL